MFAEHAHFTGYYSEIIFQFLVFLTSKYPIGYENKNILIYELLIILKNDANDSLQFQLLSIFV